MGRAELIDAGGSGLKQRLDAGHCVRGAGDRDGGLSQRHAIRPREDGGGDVERAVGVVGGSDGARRLRRDGGAAHVHRARRQHLANLLHHRLQDRIVGQHRHQPAGARCRLCRAAGRGGTLCHQPLDRARLHVVHGERLAGAHHVARHGKADLAQAHEAHPLALGGAGQRPSPTPCHPHCPPQPVAPCAEARARAHRRGAGAPEEQPHAVRDGCGASGAGARRHGPSWLVGVARISVLRSQRSACRR